MSTLTYSYFKTTGAKFMGTELEFQEIYTGCKKQMPLSDEEGYFSKFLCCEDFKICDKCCNNHIKKPELNPLIEEFFYNCCNFPKVSKV